MFPNPITITKPIVEDMKIVERELNIFISSLLALADPVIIAKAIAMSKKIYGNIFIMKNITTISITFFGVMTIATRVRQNDNAMKYGVLDINNSFLKFIFY